MFMRSAIRTAQNVRKNNQPSGQWPSRFEAEVLTNQLQHFNVLKRIPVQSANTFTG